MTNNAGRAMFQASSPMPVPHAVPLRHLARLVDEDIEGQPVVLHVAAHDRRLLRDDRDDRDAAREYSADRSASSPNRRRQFGHQVPR